jgi:hypothetical protein
VTSDHTAESTRVANDERWRQKILAEVSLTYRALAGGPVAWHET